jgi:dolichol-phosphate mannosyltransferase
MLSVVVPVFNEEENLSLLYDRLVEAGSHWGQAFELIFINDGSTDRSAEVLAQLAARDQRVKVVNFRRNFGQTAAMMAGIDYASGDYIVPMDGDLQNDPADIARMLKKLEEGYDVVSGWRSNRQDSFVIRTLPSRIANRLISKISGVSLHDYGCSLKVYRASVLKQVRLYGEMHRFLPIYASWQGAKITEMPVNHYPRVHGKSKYGLERTVKVILDLIVVAFLERYQTKPIYVLGGFGVASLILSFCTGMYALYLKVFQGTSFILTPLPLLAALTSLVGVLGILVGLVAEMVTRTYFESQGRRVYVVRDEINTVSSSRLTVRDAA